MECYCREWNNNVWRTQKNLPWAILGSMMAHGLLLAGVLLHQPSPGRVVVPVETVTVTLLQAAPRGGGDGRPGPAVQPQAAPPQPKPVCPPPKPRVKSKSPPKVKLTSPPLEPTTAPVIPTPASPPAVKSAKAATSATGRAGSSGALGAGQGGRGTGSGGGVGSGQGRGSGTGNALQGYLWQIRKLLEKQKEYPFMARRRNLEGVVLLLFTINAGGQVDVSRVSRSSGHDLLDEAARNTIRRVGRFPPLPGELNRQKLTIELPLAFRLNE